MKNFFISYNQADRKWAEWVAWQLEEAGYSIILQAWDFRPGTSFVLNMQRAASESERTIAILSKDYLNSLFTQPEWAAAVGQDPTAEKSTLIPVRIKKCDLKGILSSIVCIDLIEMDETDAKSTLIEGIQRERIKPMEAPDFPGTVKAIIKEKPSFPGTILSFWNVPQRRNPNFTGREEVLSKLADDLNSGHPAALTQTIAGLGGIGKTQIALEYAYRYRTEYEAIWWLRAEKAGTLSADYAAFAKAANLPERDAQEEQIIVKAVKRWLEQSRNWLFIFDNAQKPEDIHDYLPGEPTGHILITSRHQAWGKLGSSFSIDTWSRSESVDFLFKRTNYKDRPSAESVAEELGDLPLALEQAAAYMNETSIGFGDYLKLFQSRRDELWKEEVSPLDYPATVATTWSLAIEKVREEVPTGALILNLCSYFAPDEIPRVLMSDASEYLPEDLSPVFKDTIALNKGIKALNHYSLIVAQPDSLSVHRLIQAVVRERLKTEDQKLWAEVAVRTVNAVFPYAGYKHPNLWPKCAALLSHGRVVIEHAVEHEEALETAAELITSIASYLYGRASYKEAETLTRRSLDLREALFGKDDSGVGISTNRLGFIWKAQGKYTEAEPLYRRVLEIHETQLGADHPEVATDYNNLATLLHAQVKYSEAEPLYRRALEIRETQLGADHPTVAISLNNLALLLQDQGKYSEAEPLFRCALEIRETQLGADHLTVATSLNNLALLLKAQGKYSEAEPLLRRALEIRETQLGADHLTVAASLNNLAILLQDQGMHSEAEPLLRRALEIREMQLGAGYPEVATDLNNLALLLKDQGKYSEAEPLYRHVLEIRETQLGADHLEVAFSLNNLALLLKDQGKYSEAEPLLRRALEIGETKLGRNHPSTNTVRSNLEVLLSDMKSKGG